MTRTLVKLQFLLWRRSLRTNPSSAVWAVLIFIYALFGLLSLGALSVIGIVDGKFEVIAAAVGIGTLAYLLVSLMFPSGEGQLSPDSFAVYPLRPRQLAPGFALAAIIQTRGVAVLFCTLVSTIVFAVTLATTGHVGASIVALPAMMLQGLITIVLGLCLGTALGGKSSRASKERSTIIASFAFLIMYFGYLTLINRNAEGFVNIDALGKYLMWTPIAAAGGIVTGVAEGSVLAALGCLVIALATLGAATYFWLRGINDQLAAPLDRAQRATRVKKERTTDVARIPLLLPGLRYSLPAMVYSRALTYVRRDTRLLSSFIMQPLFGAYFLYQSAQGQPAFAYLGGWIIAMLVASIASNDYGYDGPANWLQLSSGAAARKFVPARHLASVTLSYVLLCVYLIAMNALASDHQLAALLTAVIIGMAISAGGIALLLSTHNPFPVAKPGTNPWQDKSGFSAAAMLSGLGSLLFGWIPSVPGLVLILIGHFGGASWLALIGVVLSLGIPAALYWFAFRRAVQRVEQHYPEIFAKVRSHVN